MPTTLTLTPTGQVLTVPTSWADVTLAQFLLLDGGAEEGDKRTVPELLLGLEAGALNQLATDDVLYIHNLVAFSLDKSDVYALLPPPGLPDVGSLPWGCMVLVQQRLASDEGAVLPYVLAVYRCQLAHGNTNRVEEVEAALLAAPVTEVYAEAQAFTQACRRSLSATPRTPSSTTASPATKSRMRAAKSWLSGLGLRLRSTPSP